MLNILDKMAKFFTTTNIRSVVILLTVFLTFGLVFTLVFVDVPSENKTIIDMATGSVLTIGYATVYNFLFGSSKTETDKAEKPMKKDLAN